MSDPVFLIFFEDYDRRPEIFLGDGAEVCARQRFEQVLGGGWNAHLFQCIDDGKRPLFHGGNHDLSEQGG